MEFTLNYNERELELKAEYYPTEGDGFNEPCIFAHFQLEEVYLNGRMINNLISQETFNDIEYYLNEENL